MARVRRGALPAAAIADSGRAVIAWNEGEESRHGRLLATLLDPGAAATPPRVLSRPRIREDGYTIGLQATATRTRIFLTWLAKGSAVAVPNASSSPRYRRARPS